MANAVKEANLATREARSRLDKRKKPHWRLLDSGLHLGYFKGERGGSWIGRRYAGKGKYSEKTLGTADDRQDADGNTILTFSQAKKHAEAWAAGDSERTRLEKLGAPLTVGMAVEEYLAAREKAGLLDGSYRLKRHLLTHPIADKLLAGLKSTDLSDWLGNLAGKDGKPLKPATIARTATDLKAALNAARPAHPEQLPDGPGFQLMVKDGLKPRKAMAPATRKPQILSDAKLKAVDAAAIEVDEDGDWEGDLRMMLAVLAATGTRFSQAARITVGDVQQAERRIMVPVSRKGRGEKNQSHTRCPVPAELIDLLKPALDGRDDDEILLLRPRWKQTGPVAWVKTGREPWLHPSELSRPWQAIREKVGLSADIVPYTFRHSSIVRWLRKGKPVLWVAKLHDTSSAMIDSHYGAFILDADDEHAAEAVVPLLSTPVMPLLRAVPKEAGRA